MRLAPQEPTTETLQALHPLSRQGMERVHQKRLETTEALKFGRSLLVIMGPCAMTEDFDATLEENKRIAEFGEEQDIIVLHRLPPWKPRSDPDAWHGLETTDPGQAHHLATEIAEQSGNLAIEFGHASHVQRYLSRTALGWRGSRNDGDTDLLHAIKESNPHLPIALKNGMSGHINTAFKEANLLSSGRAAPATLLFRGGGDFATKDKWVNHFSDILEITDGDVIVDVAHGGEQAHDPNQGFAKSSLGQLACMQSIISIAENSGRLPRGIMIEASNIKSPTDPVVPLDAAFEAIRELAEVHRQTTMREHLTAAD